jgi:hypothetical protein
MPTAQVRNRNSHTVHTRLRRNERQAIERLQQTSQVRGRSAQQRSLKAFTSAATASLYPLTLSASTYVSSSTRTDHVCLLMHT